MKQNDNRTLTPKLRFPEFRDEPGWEPTPLAALLDYEQPGKYIVENTNYQDSGTPVLTANKGFVLGHTSETTGVFEDVPVIIFDDFTTDKKYVDFPFKVKSSAIKILRSRGINELKLIYELMSRIRFDPTQHKRYYISQYQYLEISVPPLPEQKKIAECLCSLDELIAAEGQKLVALRDHKRGLMQQLFPQPDQTQPRLRFPEFRDKPGWTTEKLGRICNFVRGPFGGALKKEIFVPTGYAVYEQSHAIHKDLNTFRYYIDEVKYNELKRFAVKPNDIIMSCSGTMGKFAVLPSKPTLGVINQALLKLSVDKKYDLRFFAIALELPGNQSKLLAQSAGGAIKNVVGVKLLKEIEISVPGKQEQSLVADCLTALDNQITAQAAKMDALKQHKRGLMQQLFPATDELGA